MVMAATSERPVAAEKALRVIHDSCHRYEGKLKHGSADVLYVVHNVDGQVDVAAACPFTERMA